MPDFEGLKRRWKDLAPYELFEQITSRIVMFFISIVIVYSLILMGIELSEQLGLGLTFIENESLRDVFGSILTILILIEFNHSIAVALSKKSGILQARPIVLITILVIARKVILLDFNTATFEKMVAISGMAVAFGVLYWLMTAGLLAIFIGDGHQVSCGWELTGQKNDYGIIRVPADPHAEPSADPRHRALSGR
jgi:uncharacterized membrane protein (DUF373 family)